MSLNVNPTKGMKDWLPKEADIREQAKSTIINTYRSFGFNKIETPMVEHLHLLSGSDGGENQKLIFKILNRGEKLDLTNAKTENDLCESALRFDLTVPLARFYAKNSAQLPSPFKSIQIDPVWRAEQPAKGRYRQFVQCDIDIIGDDTIFAEIDLLAASAQALQNLGFDRFSFKVNDRRILTAVATYCGFDEDQHGALFIILDKIDKIGLDGVQKELEKNDYSSESIEKVINLLDSFTEGKLTLTELSDTLKENIDTTVFDDLQTLLSTINGQYETISADFSLTLVRGMGYYTGPIFEIAHADFSGSIGGGGRYNKMIGKMIGKDVPACGISLGFERLMSIISDSDMTIGNKQGKIALIYDPKRDSIAEVYKKASTLRTNDNIVSLTKTHKKFGKLLDRLAEQEFTQYLVFGNDEIKDFKH